MQNTMYSKDEADFGDKAESGLAAFLAAAAERVLADEDLMRRLRAELEALPPHDEVDAAVRALGILVESSPELRGRLEHHQLRRESLPSTVSGTSATQLSSNSTAGTGERTGDKCPCKPWTRAVCSQEGYCVCPQNYTATDSLRGKSHPWEHRSHGFCAEHHPEPPAADPQRKKRVAVVGCGIAGALTALELADRDEVEHVTVFDRESGCGVGTSGRIAAEMMFYYFHKSVWASTWNTIRSGFKAFVDSQFQVSIDGVINGFSHHLLKKAINPTITKVTIKTWEWNETMFEEGLGGMPQLLGGSIKKTRVPGAGYIAAISGMPFHRITRLGAKVNNEVQLMIKEALEQTEEVTISFFDGDLRMNTAYQDLFYSGAQLRMKHLVKKYPELCEAVIAPICCHDPTARKWVKENPTKAGYTCGDATEMGDMGGCVHIFTSSDSELYKTATAKKSAYNTFSLKNPKETRELYQPFLPSNQSVGGCAHNQDGGFVRTELLFQVIQSLLERSNHTFKFGHELQAASVSSDDPSRGRVVLTTKLVGGRWEDQDQSTNNRTVRVFAEEDIVDETPASQFEFDRVVLAPGAAVNGALSSIDPALNSEKGLQIMPVFGYVVQNAKESWFEEEYRAIGVIFEEEKQYVRAMRNGGVAIGGGMYFGDIDDQSIRRLRYDGDFDGDSYMKKTKLGEEVVRDPETLRLGGVRPLSPFGFFPALKSYWNGRVVLNTGAGVNGFVCSWKAAELAADIALHSTTIDDRWKPAFTDV